MSKHNYSQYSNKQNNKTFETTTIENKAVTDTDVTVTTIENNSTVLDNTVENQNGIAANMPIEGVDDTTTTTVDADVTIETNSGSIATGIVANCAKLNVRSKPNTTCDVITILNACDEVSIDVDESTDEWFKIRTANGVKGYCMRKFVNANI